MHTAFWNEPSSSANDYLKSAIEKRKLEANFAAFCLTFSSLFLLASPEAIETHREKARALLATIWAQFTKAQNIAITEAWFTGLTYISFMAGIQAPFLQLYSMGSPESFDDSILLDRGLLSHAQQHSSLCTHYFDLIMG